MEVRTQTIERACCWGLKMNDETKVTSEQPSGKDPGKDLVGSKIKVWWPLDKMFYEGVVESFDPIKKKHKVSYLDGDDETLCLKEECWEIVHGNTVAEKVNTNTENHNHKRKRVVQGLKLNASRNSTSAAEDGLPEMSGHCANNTGNKKDIPDDLPNWASPEFSAFLNIVCTKRIADFNVDKAHIKKDSVQDNDKMFRESAAMLQSNFIKSYLQTQYSNKELQVIRAELNDSKEKINILEVEIEAYKKALELAKAELEHLRNVTSSAVGNLPTPIPFEPHHTALRTSSNVATRQENLEGNVFGLSK